MITTQETEKLIFDWASDGRIDTKKIDKDFFCSTRDVFQARLDKMLNEMLISSDISEDSTFILSAITGEIGNNSFDHNLGSWPDIMGLFFYYALNKGAVKVILADRGQGVFKTLKKVKSELKNDEEALKTAFTEKISGRAPENRGNGLKFVRDNIQNRKMHLRFNSGNAELELNDKIEIKKADKKVQGCLAILTL